MDIRKLLQTLDNLESKKIINESFKDQVSGTEKAKKKSNDEHPFKGRLVGEGRVKELSMDLKKPPEGLSDTEFKKKYNKTKQEWSDMLKKKNKDNVAEGTLDNVDPNEIVSMIDNELEMGNHYEGAVISVSDELDMDPTKVDNIYRKNSLDSDAIPPIDFGLDEGVAGGSSDKKSTVTTFVTGCDWDKVVEWLEKNIGPTTLKSPNYINGWHGQGWALFLNPSRYEPGKLAFQVRADTDLSEEQLKSKIEMFCKGGAEDLAESFKKEYQLYLESIKQHPKYNGLEGPFTMRSGKTVYYEESTGTYIDADSEKLNEYGPVGTSASTTTPGGNSTVQQKTGTSSTTVNQQQKDNNPNNPNNANNANNTNINQQQQQQQQQQNKTVPGQQPNEPAEVGPQDIAMGFLKGMGINNPGKQQVDALAKSLAQNLKKAP